MNELKKLSIDEWTKEGEKLFGKDKKTWQFKCVQCGNVQTYHDFEKLGIESPEHYVHFSCIGRFNEKKTGCDWTLGGLFTIHKVEVEDNEGKTHPCFEFNTE